jgi:hypothetical protein
MYMSRAITRGQERPAVILSGELLCVGRGNVVMLPLEVMRPIPFPPGSANHRLPSGPAVMPLGKPAGENSVMVPTAAQARALLRLSRQIPAIRAVPRAVRCDRHPERFMVLPPLCVLCYAWV